MFDEKEPPPTATTAAAGGDKTNWRESSISPQPKTEGRNWRSVSAHLVERFAVPLRWPDPHKLAARLNDKLRAVRLAKLRLKLLGLPLAEERRLVTAIMDSKRAEWRLINRGDTWQAASTKLF
jgi:hypothetical protein